MFEIRPSLWYNCLNLHPIPQLEVIVIIIFLCIPLFSMHVVSLIQFYLNLLVVGKLFSFTVRMY